MNAAAMPAMKSAAMPAKITATVVCDSSYFRHCSRSHVPLESRFSMGIVLFFTLRCAHGETFCDATLFRPADTSHRRRTAPWRAHGALPNGGYKSPSRVEQVGDLFR